MHVAKAAITPPDVWAEEIGEWVEEEEEEEEEGLDRFDELDGQSHGRPGGKLARVPTGMTTSQSAADVILY
jgi:hypothetical protein